MVENHAYVSLLKKKSLKGWGNEGDEITWLSCQNEKYVASMHATPYDKGLQNGNYLFILGLEKVMC